MDEIEKKWDIMNFYDKKEILLSLRIGEDEANDCADFSLAKIHISYKKMNKLRKKINEW